MTMLKKNFFSAAEAYAAPVCETLDLTIEMAILEVSYGDPGKAGTIGTGNAYNFGDGD